MITTTEELLAWIPLHPQRHQQTGDLTCSCGWSTNGALEEVTWQSHFDAMLICDLGDVLPSDSGTLGGERDAWRPLVISLYESIDIRDRLCTCDWEWPESSD